VRLNSPSLILFVLLAVLPARGAEIADPTLRRAAAEIRGESIRATMKMLADDLMEGREAGSRGYEVAAAYMAARLEALGLEPAGEGGTFFQRVPFRAARVSRGESSVELATPSGTVPLSEGEDFLLSANYLQTEVTLDAPLVFAGYGVRAPELQHDDYAGLDARGKIVVALRGAPSGFPHNQRAYYSSNSVKAAAAAENGAVGLLHIAPPDEGAASRWARSVEHAGNWGMRWFDGELSPAVVPAIRLQATLSDAGVEKVFAGGKVSAAAMFAQAKESPPSGFDLLPRMRVRLVSEHREVSSRNVAAMLRGSDEKLSGEYLVYTAHLDGLGMRDAVEGDSIYNGAYDNASGCAALVEIARAFRALPEPPARSVLFLLLTAEEKGLQGADYFVNRPTVPLDRIVANLNIDMFLALFPVRSIVAFGAEHSTLGPVIERAAAQTGFVLRPDHAPEEVVFIRSDQFPFVRKGIPAIFVTSGVESTEPEAGGLAVEKRWLREVYHSRRDDMSQQFDFASLVRFATLQFVAGHAVAGAAERPRWNPGDFFGRKFSKTSE
jgi:Zn-dependent M28 family amino/carboxypeptidase